MSESEIMIEDCCSSLLMTSILIEASHTGITESEICIIRGAIEQNT